MGFERNFYKCFEHGFVAYSRANKSYAGSIDGETYRHRSGDYGLEFPAYVSERAAITKVPKRMRDPEWEWEMCTVKDGKIVSRENITDYSNKKWKVGRSGA